LEIKPRVIDHAIMHQAGDSAAKTALRRKLFMIGAASGSLISFVCAWLDWQNGLTASIYQDLTLATVLLPLLFWAWKSPNPGMPARAGMLVFSLSFMPSIPDELLQMPLFLLWLPAVSLLSFYFFGFREGVIWSALFFVLVLAESLWVLSGVASFQFEEMFIVAMIIYLFVAGVAAAFQKMIESFERQIVREAEEKQQVQKRMAEIQKMESIGVLAAGIAHDFNTLLVGVMGNAELAMLDNRQHALQPFLQRIFKSASHGADLVQHMLAYSGQGKISMGCQNMSQLVEDVLEILSPSIGQQVRMDKQLATALPDVYGDKNQLMQVIMNLITNASESMQGKPGDITLRTGISHLGATDFSSMKMAADCEAGEFVFLEVTDTGCGMDDETQTRIFDPFFTTKESGSGLGLAALLGIVRSHSGALALQSTPGAGSCFTVYLPASL